MGNRHAKSAKRNSRSSSSLDRRKHLEHQITLLRSISAHSHFSKNENAVVRCQFLLIFRFFFFYFAEERRKVPKWMTYSHRSLPYAPSSNSILSSISNETTPSHPTANTSSICVASHEGESVEMIPEVAERSHTMDCGGTVFRFHIVLFDFREHSPLQSSNEIPEMEMQLKNPAVFLTPKSIMNRKKSLSASWLIEREKGLFIISEFSSLIKILIINCKESVWSLRPQ
uniref:Uncharacterized protein n=1 Tax=Onchocerca volvulus TaxID=6282 RepID=A0A8R1XQ84_ONCVO